jgi:hypothetical protein
VNRDAMRLWREQPIDDALAGCSLTIPASVIGETERLLRTYGTEGEAHEGVVYLAGREHGGESVALCALSPVAVTSPGSFQTHSDANARVVQILGDLSLTLIGQVHSHPGLWVGHSVGDDEGALVRFAGYWSLIVPFFARDGMLPIDRCGVHLYQRGHFSQLSTSAVHHRIRVVPTSVDLRAEK